MKKVMRTIGLLLLCGALLAPAADAQSRGRGRQERRESSQHSGSHSSRPGNMGHGNNSQRPSGNQSRPNHNNNNRPNHNNNRPNHNNGNHNNQGFRPGNNNRPNHDGNHNNQGFRPGNNNRPNHNGFRPDHGRPNPGHNYRPNPGHGHRPDHFGHRPSHVPHFNGWHRPAPPRHWRPAPHWRPFRSILGISFGTAFGLSINALINNGYNINYYGDNTVYVSQVPMLNMMWPDAVLYYNGGGLCGSRFVYSTGYYDMNRYNMTYASLVNGYGTPMSFENTPNGVEATWWGSGGQFIRLSFQSGYAQNGALRYFTTLSFGN